ncbi:MAG: serine/threonine protein kinase [Gammaproteobacteria bacterium]
MTAHYYDALTPDAVMDAVESLDLVCDGRLLALNSYENRVYQVGIEDDTPVIAKFYRAGRWSDAAIREEHVFACDLAERDIPVIPPARINNETLHQSEPFRFALYDRHGGHTPELSDPEHLEWLGRVLGRIHAYGATKKFTHRLNLDVATVGQSAFDYIIEQRIPPDYLFDSWQQAASNLLALVSTAFTEVSFKAIRLHGDCHLGNLLWTDGGPHFVDLDDCLNGPAMQDLWMLLSGNHADMRQQFEAILTGYEEFMEFDLAELRLIEPLRALRMIHYCGWLAKRWDDPAFPLAFPWFNTPAYWEDQLDTLRQQQEKLQEPALRLKP